MRNDEQLWSPENLEGKLSIKRNLLSGVSVGFNKNFLCKFWLSVGQVWPGKAALVESVESVLMASYVWNAITP